MWILELHQQPQPLFLLLILILGLLVGSFLNVVIYRLPIMLVQNWKAESREFLAGQGESYNEVLEFKPPAERFNLIVPRSRCPHCHHLIKAWQNIPVLSYLLLKGRCGNCQEKISFRYPIIEAVSGLLTAIVFFHFGPTESALYGVLLTWCLIALTMIDVDHQLLPDHITLPLLWLGIIANSFGVFTDLSSSVYGAIFGYLSLWSVYWSFKLLTGKEGMGFGDFKLLAALGAWMGWQMLPLIVILSSFVGALIGIAGIIILGRDKNIPIPFGPYLAIAGWIAFLWGEQITSHYLQFASVS